MKRFKPLLFCALLGLSSCEAPLDLDGFLSKNINVLWSSDDGRIVITCQGFAFEEGRALLKINGKDTVTSTCFDDLYDSLNFFVPAGDVGHVYDVMELNVESISGDGKLSLKMNSNASGDPFYNDYSTILSKRPLKENELDAKYFNNGWVNKEHGLVLPNRIYSYLNPRKEGTFNGKSIYFQFLDDYRFVIEYQESSEIFASGRYVTHFDNMDLIFDEGCGSDVFGMEINMLWASGMGEPLPPFEG